MGTLAQTKNAEFRRYADPKHPESSEYDLLALVTTLQNVIDPDTGKTLAQILEDSCATKNYVDDKLNADYPQDAFNNFLNAFFDETADPLMATLPQWRKDLIAALPSMRLLRVAVGSTFGGLPSMSAAVKALLGATYGYVELYSCGAGEFSIRFAPIYPNGTGGSKSLISTRFVWNQPGTTGTGQFMGYYQTTEVRGTTD